MTKKNIFLIVLLIRIMNYISLKDLLEEVQYLEIEVLNF